MTFLRLTILIRQTVDVSKGSSSLDRKSSNFKSILNIFIETSQLQGQVWTTYVFSRKQSIHSLIRNEVAAQYAMEVVRIG